MTPPIGSGGLEVEFDLPAGGWSIRSKHDAALWLASAPCTVVWEDGGLRPRRELGALSPDPSNAAEEYESSAGPARLFRSALVREEGQHRLILDFALGIETDFLLLRATWENRSSRASRLHQIGLIEAEPSIDGRGQRGSGAGRAPRHSPGVSLGAKPDEVRLYSNGWQSWSFAGSLGPQDRMPRSRLGPLTAPLYTDAGAGKPRQRGDFTSEWFVVLGQPQGPGLIAGYLSQRQAFGSFAASVRAPLRLRSWLSGDGVQLDPGASFSTDWLYLAFTTITSTAALDLYLDAIGHANEIRQLPDTPIGWCSWYQFFDRVTERDIRRNLEWSSARRDTLPLNVFQIDDGYQSAVGDWFDQSARFETPMAELGREITSAGFRPGLWLAPFVARPGAKLLGSHPDWILRNRAGRPVNGGFIWNRFIRALDVTHLGVREHLARVFERVVNDWGYTYLKLDFLYAGALPGRRAEPHLTRAQALTQAFSDIRTAVGPEVFLLGCGSPLGPSVGFFDGMRIGPDVAGSWDPRYGVASRFFRSEPSYPSARNAARNTVNRAWMHRKLWLNDPDCLVIRDAHGGLSEAEAQTLASLIALSAGALVDSDDLPNLSPERMAWLTKLIPPLPGAATALDGFEHDHPKILYLPLEGVLGSWILLALVNWEAHPVEGTLDLAPLPLDPDLAYVGIDFWREQPIAPHRGRLRLGELPAHGVRLISLRRLNSGSPTWLGDTLHVSQGLSVDSWDVQDGRVRAGLAHPIGSPSSVWLRLPGSFRSAEIGDREVPFKTQGTVVRLTLDSAPKALLDVRWSPDSVEEHHRSGSSNLSVPTPSSGAAP